MNYILYILFAIIIVMLIVLLVSSNKRSKELQDIIVERTTNEESKIELEQFKMVSEGRALSSQISKHVDELNKQVYGFSKSMDEKMNYVLDYEQALANIFINNKTRGIYGETQLNMLLQNYFGEHRQLYQTQYLLKNGTIVDCAIFLGEEKRVLAIDSKFPMQNYLRFQEADNDFDKKEAFKNFKANMKVHINAISDKYISDETVEQAIMFLPSEAIYYFVLSECQDIVDYSISKKVNITSPTTLFPICSAIVTYHKEITMVKSVKEQVQMISKLQGDIDTLVTRSEDASKALDTLVKRFDLMNITIRKVDSKHKKVTEMHEKNELEED